MEMASSAKRTCRISYIISVVSFLFLLLKLGVRSRVTRKLGWDDFFVTLAFAISIPLTIAFYLQAKYGMGYHSYDLPMDILVQQTKWFWATVWLYITTLGLSKIAILMQYLRIFIAESILIAVWACVVFVAAYTIQGVFVGIFQCNPPAGFWDPDVKAHCINQLPYYYIAAGLNIATDFVIILIPIPALRSLHISRSRKAGIFLVFSIGGFGCVVSLIRLHALIAFNAALKNDDRSFVNTTTAMWSQIEVHICIICACLPSLSPIFTRLFAMTGLARSPSTSKTPVRHHPANTAAYPPRGRAWPQHHRNSFTMLSTSSSSHALAPLPSTRQHGNYSSEAFELRHAKDAGLQLDPTPRVGRIAVETKLEVHSTTEVDHHVLEETRTASVGDGGSGRESEESEEIGLVPEAHRGWYHAQIERDKL